MAPPAPLAPNSGVQLLALIGGDPKPRAVVTDLEGNILWYYDQLTGFPSPIQFLPNGNFLLADATLLPGSFDTVLREMDLAGGTVRELTASQLNQRLVARGFEPVAEEFHHDVVLLPNGHVMALTLYHKQFTDVAGFEGQTIDVVGDALVELDADWQPVWDWSPFDHLDVNRHPFGFPDPRLGFDWTHANALVYTAADRNLIVSLRHQHWVIKIDYQDGFGTGQVLWRFGAEGDFALLNGGLADFSYAQHFPVVLDPQASVYRMAVFDNGNDRPFDAIGTPCDPQAGRPCFSRAVIYEMDETMKTARVLWEDRFGIYAPFLGSVQLFANGNVLWDAGTLSGSPNAVIREVTQEATPQTVWQMDVTGQFVYRSLRLPSLYPEVQW